MNFALNLEEQSLSVFLLASEFWAWDNAIFEPEVV